MGLHLQSRQRRLVLTLAAALAAAPTTTALADDPPEEMIVTGSYIRGSAEDAALPVTVLDQQDLQDQGSPTIIEMVRNLNITSGNVGETNQFQGGVQGTEGVATINLRGLGSARTLVLLNGHRMVADNALGVDISAIPASAIGRLEVLKDGAAALYGSDAIGGVVNMITRHGFEGLELRGSEQFIEDSDGEHELSFAYGWASENLDFLVAGEWQHRSELRARDRDFAVRPQSQNPQGGWSGIGNPGRILPASAGGAIIGAGGADPRCSDVGGAVVGPACQFQFTFFDNLIEPQDTYKLYSEANYSINENTTLHVEGLYSLMDMEHWKTSPSYPPQSLFGPDRFIAPNHPGLLDMRARYPDRVDLFGPEGSGAFTLSRYLGATGFHGDAQQGGRVTESYRYGATLSGTAFADAIDYELSGYYSRRERNIWGNDMYVERMAFALDGLGGPNCDQSSGTPGVGGCQYYNPFSNAIERSVITGFVNPDFNPAVANSSELVDWLIGKQRSHTTNELFVIDFVASGETPWSLPGGPISIAVGMQTRNEKYDLALNSLANVAENPCPFNDPRSIALGNTASLDCGSITGPLAFLSGTTEERTSRTVYGFFAEAKVPFSDTLDAQLAIRFEDYGGDVGSSIDPKLAVRWQATEWLALRGSVSTTFRGPPQSFLSGTNTALIFIAPANAFKAVDVIGNASLKPETALAQNFGAVIQAGGLFASVDYWRFDFEDPFQTESSSQIVAAYVARGCQDGGAGAATAECAVLRSHIFPLGTSAALLNRVDTNFINGGDISTSGIDFFVQYDFEEVLGGELSLGAEATYTIEFDSDDFVDINGLLLAPGGDFNGLLNDTTPFPAKPDIKGNVFVRYVNGTHRATTTLRYVDEYTDSVTPVAEHNFKRIDSHMTLDLNYSVGLLEDALTVSASVFNLLDNDPPRTATDLNYDPFSANPSGRMFKLGFTYQLAQQ